MSGHGETWRSGPAWLSGQVVIRLIGAAGNSTVAGGPDSGWLKDYAPEHHGGLGEIFITQDPREAMRFPSTNAAFECYRAIPRTRPVRPDGKPNRPLTAWSIEIMSLAKALEGGGG